MPKAAKIYIGAVVAAGTSIAAYALYSWDSKDPIRFLAFLALFAGAALLKARIPGITGTYSPVFFFVLLGSHTFRFPRWNLPLDWPESCNARFSFDAIRL